MLKSRDFKELLSTLAGHEVRQRVVGGYAVVRLAEPDCFYQMGSSPP
jgi:hypothetical protein